VNTRTLATVIVFAALTVALNISPIKIPAPYAPFLIYQIWEIPILAAFLLFGTGTVILIALINTAALLAFFPGALPTGPLYNLAAVLSMLLGVGITKLLVEKHSVKNEIFIASVFTMSGILFRTVSMVFLNYALLRFPPPVGYGMPEAAIIATIPLVTIFNVTLALYTIPLGYSLAKAVTTNLKLVK